MTRNQLGGILSMVLLLAGTSCSPRPDSGVNGKRATAAPTAASTATTASPSSALAPVSTVAVPIEPRSPLATWPWPHATVHELKHGMRATSVDGADGTRALLLTFDATKEPSLHFELYDADEDDAVPNDDQVKPVNHLTMPWAWDHLKTRGTLLAVVNGPFFKGDTPVFQHTAPVVRKGKVYCNVGDYRWGLAIKESPQGPQFSLLHRPTRQQLEKFDWGSGNVQALVVDGKPKTIAPPSSGIPPRKSPASQPDDCGPYPYIDYVKTARVSIGWRRREFAILVITQAAGESENTSMELRERGEHQRSGWDLVDLQTFWLAWKAEGACNLDGGLSTQVGFLGPDGPEQRLSTAPYPQDKNFTRVMPVLLFPYVVVR